VVQKWNSNGLALAFIRCSRSDVFPVFEFHTCAASPPWQYWFQLLPPFRASVSSVLRGTPQPHDVRREDSSWRLPPAPSHGDVEWALLQHDCEALADNNQSHQELSFFIADSRPLASAMVYGSIALCPSPARYLWNFLRWLERVRQRFPRLSDYIAVTQFQKYCTVSWKKFILETAEYGSMKKASHFVLSWTFVQILLLAALILISSHL